MSEELNYSDNPLPQSGIEYLCMCPQGPAGARRSEGLGNRYWCMRCGKGLGLKEIDSCVTVNKNLWEDGK